MRCDWIIKFLLCAGAIFGKETLCTQEFVNGAVGFATPPASPTTDGIRAIVKGDFLYWIVREDGLEYDLLSRNVSSSHVLQGVSIREIDFQWSPGFRFALGYRHKDDHWEIKGIWTRLETSASSAAHVVDGEGLRHNGVWNDANGIVESSHTIKESAHWWLHYNLLTFGFSRSFFLGKNLSADLSFGGIGLWIHQLLDVAEEYASPASIYYTSIPTYVFLQPQLKSVYNAGGLFLQWSPTWNIDASWSILGSIAAYIAHGKYTIHQIWNVPELSEGDLGIQKLLHRTRIGTQGAIGVEWQTDPRRLDWHLAIGVQYEGTYWLKQNLFSQVDTTFAENYERRSDLEMDGVSVSCRLDF